MYIVVFITAKDADEANRIAEKLVEEKLAACVNIVSSIKSIFWWEGKVDRADEALLILKSQKNLLNKIIKTVKSLHSYTVPEVIALPVVGGNADYLKWVKASCAAPVSFKKSS